MENRTSSTDCISESKLRKVKTNESVRFLNKCSNIIRNNTSKRSKIECRNRRQSSCKEVDSVDEFNNAMRILCNLLKQKSDEKIKEFEILRRIFKEKEKQGIDMCCERGALGIKEHLFFSSIINLKHLLVILILQGLKE
ncbi:uncharacterized protein LOC119682415 [Teleopsis dalmanni]|uniref:uncharacterized protein LOC119682415 n=1 Tax=Teleopsis dalmanni TaxID=139649 RepID=UPI0018CDF220|nr:uncharacterized protein LOC119682415 [Teleopsis dalmanni]